MNRGLGRRKIAIVGSGISGAAAAWALNPTHDVTLFEANTSAGGHTATVDIDYDGTLVSVDTGFIVYNELNYPLLTALFQHLHVKTHSSEMSFALSLDDGRLEWSGQSYGALFAQRRNLVSPGFYWMLREVLRFNKQCLIDRAAGLLSDKTIGEYIAWRGFAARFRDDYLVPMGAAIWSTPRASMLDFPALAFVNFFDNHRLIYQDRPAWRTVTGGSRNYLGKLLAPLGNRVRLDEPVVCAQREHGKIIIRLKSGRPETFDAAVFAGHSNQTLAILDDASPEETAILSAIKFRPNRVVLHRDPALMPRRRAAWSAWNYLRSSRQGGEPEITMTYWMNRLQGIDETKPLFVSLNPEREPKTGSVFGEWTYEHPQFDAAALAAQKRLSFIQGRWNCFFAGAWTGYGFHEDGLRSGLEAAAALGAAMPWHAETGLAEAAE
jgi:uncharacterized protein